MEIKDQKPAAAAAAAAISARVGSFNFLCRRGYAASILMRDVFAYTHTYAHFFAAPLWLYVYSIERFIHFAALLRSFFLRPRLVCRLSCPV